MAKNPVIDDRIILNGNRLFFLEPLEASALQTYLEWARYVFDVMGKKHTVNEASIKIKDYIRKVEKA